MFTVATWNPGGGLGALKGRSTCAEEKTSAKKNFIRDILNKTYKADISIISHYSEGGQEPVNLGYDSFKCFGRTLFGIQRGSFDQMSDAHPLPPNYMFFKYKSLNDGVINVLAVYAGGRLYEAHKNLENVLLHHRAWLSREKTLIVGDLNIWENLADDNGKRSTCILKTIKQMGFVSAFHNDAGNPQHRSPVQRGRHDSLDLTTFEDHRGQTYIDYIFISRDLQVIPGSSRIVHFKCKEEIERRKIEGGKKNGRQDHSAVVASVTSTGK